jgi:hypothetical protein
MAIAHDTNTRFPATNGTTGVDSTDTTTGDRTFSHAGSINTRAAVVTVENRTVTTAVVSGVLYGGVAMTLIASATDTSENGRVEIYVLITSVPTGTQTVTLQGCTASAKWASCSTVTAARQVGVLDFKTRDTTTSTNPTVTMVCGADSMAYGVIHAGNAAPATSGITGCTLQYSQDHGALCANAVRRTSVTTPSSYDIGVTLASDDNCIAAVALCEAQSWPNSDLIDPFTYSNGSLVSVSGGKWLANPMNDPGEDGISVASNQLVMTGTTVGAVYYSTSFPANQDAWIQYAIATDYTGIYLRLQSPATAGADGYLIELELGTLIVYRFDNTSGTQIGPTETVAPLLDGAWLGASINGSTIQPYRRTLDVWVPMGTARSDATYSGAGYVGFVIADVDGIVDNFGGGAQSRPKFSRRSRAPRKALMTTGSYR